MKELVILSGKGGTGKTSITAAFAALSPDSLLCDADVDAADLHLVMAPQVETVQDFEGGSQAVIRVQDCSGCGRCQEVCRFEAVMVDKDKGVAIDPLGCEGCGVCVDLCPEQAIDFNRKICGQRFVSATRFGPMVHARLGIAQENSGRLVALVREEARKQAQKACATLILTDGPPGIGCPVIAAMGQATAVLIVTEPTVSGIHDLLRVADLAAHFRLPAMVCINKQDLNPEQGQAIEEIARTRGLAMAGAIPFDPAVTQAMVQGLAVTEFNARSKAALAIQRVWDQVNRIMDDLPLGERIC